MVARNSSEWLPPGFTEKIEVKNGRKIKYYYNVANGVRYNSKKDVLLYSKTKDFFLDTPQEKNNENNGLSNNEVDALSVKTNESPEWLPHGWRMEERLRKNGSSGGSKYKIYIDLSTGNKFYSRLAVARYLKNVDPNVGLTEQPKPDTSLQSKSSAEADCISGNILEREKSSSVVVTESVSAGGLPPPEAGYIRGKKLKGKKSFTVVATESTLADGLPPGWVKEIKISKSGNKIRKDPYYIDPVSGYVFLSKKDALRYLETNNIGSCACVPKRKEEFRDSKLNTNEITLYNVGEPILEPDPPLRCKPEKKRKKKSLILLDDVGVTLTKPDVPLECKSVTKEGCIPESKKRKHSFTTVATESTSADGLPPGWIKEMKISKSGNKIRKDPYYIDPSSGYIFYSKKDVLRYLETNDMSSCAITPKRRKLIENTVPLDNGVETSVKPKANLQCKPMTDESCIPVTKKSSKQSFTLVATESTSVEGLPPGWIKEIHTSKSGDKIRKDPYYTDPVSGYVFRSKKDVMRYLETNDIGSCAITPKRRELDDLKLIKNKLHLDNVEESSLKPDITMQSKSMIDSTCITKSQNKNQHSPSMVAAEITSVDGLPPGWIKEIKTSKSGNKIRKDPYYTDPINGYIFRSKKDVLRFLETNDIGSCAIMPKKREPDDLKLIKNKPPLDNIGEPSLRPDTSIQSKSMKDASCIPKTQNKKQRSSASVATEITSVDGLPPGWIKEIKLNKSGNKDRKDPYYIDPDSGYMFRSKKDALRFLKTNDIGSCAIAPKKRESDDLMLIKSKTPVATDITSVDGLPPGWIKEIKTSKSGNKIRKDPYYIDPDNGYMFRSKKDALRFLETNDIGRCAIAPKKRESDDLKLIKSETPLDNVGEPFLKPDISMQSQPIIDATCSTKTQNKNQHSSTTVATDNTSVDGLPSGWIKEIKTCKSGNKIRKDPYYIDPDSGYMFRSKKDALRFLETNDIGSCAIAPKKRESDDLKLIKSQKPLDNVREPFLKADISMQNQSTIDAACIARKEKKNQQSSTTVVTEITSADGLPPGWIKEIKTSKSGNKIRKDPYYTDPVSGYVFRSKKDVLKFLETNDIGSCANTPKKREPHDLKLINNKTLSVSPINPKLSDHLETNTKLFSGGESSGGGGDSSNVKILAASKAKISKIAFSGADCLQDKKSCENSNEHAEDMIPKITTQAGVEQTHACSEQGSKAMADVLAICSFINESFSEEKPPGSGMEKRTDGTWLRPRKPKKIRDLNLPLRASKRLSRSEPEMISNLDLNEQALTHQVITNVDLNVANHTLVCEETLQEEEPLNKVEKLLSEDKAVSEEETLNKVEKLPAEDKTILIEHTEGKMNEKQLNDDAISQNLQPDYAFSDSWTDPCLEFAFKTLTGEISIHDSISFPDVPDNQEDGGIGTSESEVPTMFESDIPPGFESVKQNKVLENLPANPPSSSPTESTMLQIDEIPPGFESVVHNKNADTFSANPSFSSPEVSGEQGFPCSSS